MDINVNHQNKQKNDKKDDGVASQFKKKRMRNIMKVVHQKNKNIAKRSRNDESCKGAQKHQKKTLKMEKINSK
jgi:hypothetical protein